MCIMFLEKSVESIENKPSSPIDVEMLAKQS